MRLTVRLLGAEAFHVDTEREDGQVTGGDATSYPVAAPTWGFTNEERGDEV